MRTTSGSAPAARCCSSLSWECIMLAGCATNVRLPLQELGHKLRVGAMLLHPQRQGLHAHGHQESIEGAQARATVPEAQGACRDGEAHAHPAEGFIEVHAVIGVA